MTSDSRYSSTLPSALDQDRSGKDPRSASEDGASADYAVAGAIGAQLDAPLTVMRRAINAFTASGTLTPLQVKPISDALDAAHKIALQSQLLLKVAGGRLRQSHEQLNLDSVVKRALEEHAALLKQRGVEVFRSIKSVAVIVDLDLVTSLVGAAIDYAAAPGRHLLVSLDVKNWPAHAVLMLKTTRAVVSGHSKPDAELAPEPLEWHLVIEIAKAIGVTVDRLKSAEETLVMIEFPRTVREIDGLTATEVDLGAESWMSSQSRALAGHRALIVTSDIPLREDIKLICKGMGLIVDTVPSSMMAVRFCEMEKPQLIIVDERFKDEKFDELRKDLLRIEPNFPFVEIGYDNNTLSMASWMSENMTRVSRDDLSAQLPQALTLELAKII